MNLIVYDFMYCFVCVFVHFILHLIVYLLSPSYSAFKMSHDSLVPSPDCLILGLPHARVSRRIQFRIIGALQDMYTVLTILIVS